MRLELTVIGDNATRADLETAIAALTAKRDRMPAHWVDRRAEIDEARDELVARWLEAEG